MNRKKKKRKKKTEKKNEDGRCGLGKKREGNGKFLAGFSVHAMRRPTIGSLLLCGSTRRRRRRRRHHRRRRLTFIFRRSLETRCSTKDTILLYVFNVLYVRSTSLTCETRTRTYCSMCVKSWGMAGWLARQSTQLYCRSEYRIRVLHCTHSRMYTVRITHTSGAQQS